MLAFLGLITIIASLVLMLSKKLTPTATLVIVPTVTCLLAGQGASLGGYIVSGVQSVSSTTVMFIFAIIFFNLMMDAGAFDPIINAAIKFAGDDPVKITIATVILSIIGHLDGSGITTTIICCSAMLPIYKKMHMKLLNLILLCALTQGCMNIVPWGGPTLRVMTAYEATSAQVFNPIIIPMIAGLLFIVAIAVVLGKKDAKRLAEMKTFAQNDESVKDVDNIDRDESLKRPKLVAVNLVLIVVTLITMVLEILPPCPTMIFAAILALIINYPNTKQQGKIVEKYGALVINMATIMFAAGVLTGILKGSGMLDAMAEALAAAIPTSIGKMAPVIVGIIGVPASMIFTPDAWYFSILPTITTAVSGVGVDALSVARASLMGQMTLGFPGSPLLAGSFLLPAMINMEFPDYQKAWFPYAWGVSIAMLVVAIVTGAVAF